MPPSPPAPHSLTRGPWLSAKVKNWHLSKYDPQKEAEFCSWIKGLMGLSVLTSRRVWRILLSFAYYSWMSCSQAICPIWLLHAKLAPRRKPLQLHQGHGQLRHELCGPVRGQWPVWEWKHDTGAGVSSGSGREGEAQRGAATCPKPHSRWYRFTEADSLPFLGSQSDGGSRQETKKKNYFCLKSLYI